MVSPFLSLLKKGASNAQTLKPKSEEKVAKYILVCAGLFFFSQTLFTNFPSARMTGSYLCSLSLSLCYSIDFARGGVISTIVIIIINFFIRIEGIVLFRHSDLSEETVFASEATLTVLLPPRSFQS